jgi:cell division septation protein DedD
MLIFASLLTSAAVAAAADTSPVAYPHPLMTEVLYAVPNSKDGDANGDGERSATGDEFVELVNPHDKPINLKGYTLTDSREVKFEDDPSVKPGPDGKKPKKAKVLKPQFEFTFPDLTLQPGEVVVVFNGYKQKWGSPVGSKDKAAARDKKFHDAYVFSMNIESQFVAFNNSDDCVQLFAPGVKESINCITWGKLEEGSCDATLLMEKVGEARGSIHRIGLSKDWKQSPDLTGNLKGTFSPGLVELPSTAAKEATKPGIKPRNKTETKPEPKPEPKPEAKPEAKPETKPVR